MWRHVTAVLVRPHTIVGITQIHTTEKDYSLPWEALVVAYILHRLDSSTTTHVMVQQDAAA